MAARTEARHAAPPVAAEAHAPAQDSAAVRLPDARQTGTAATAEAHAPEPVQPAVPRGANALPRAQAEAHAPEEPRRSAASAPATRTPAATTGATAEPHAPERTRPAAPPAVVPTPCAIAKAPGQAGRAAGLANLGAGQSTAKPHAPERGAGGHTGSLGTANATPADAEARPHAPEQASCRPKAAWVARPKPVRANARARTKPLAPAKVAAAPLSRNAAGRIAACQWRRQQRKLARQ
jgi:hypothetical protein